MTGFELDADTYPLVRLRLADELHRRAYHDAGVEVSPGARLAESYVISTPHCQQGDTVLGELSWSADRSRLAGRFENWRQFRAHAFGVLGVERWRTRRHLGCFHRRGKARYDMTFAVTRRLVADAGRHTATLWALGTGTPHSDDVAFDEMIAASGGTPPPGRPPRFLAVSCCGQPLAALRGDGWAVTPGGVLALDDLWWRGMDVVQQASEVRRFAGHCVS